MKTKKQIHLLACIALAFIFLQNNVQGQCLTTLTSQDEVDNYSCMGPVSALTIDGASITDLSNLSAYVTSVGTLLIKNTSLTDLAGLDNLIPNGGKLTIKIHSNAALISLSGLGSDGIDITLLDIQQNSSLVNLNGLPNYSSIDKIELHNNSTLNSIFGLNPNTIVNTVILDGDITDFGGAFANQALIKLFQFKNSSISTLEGQFPASLQQINQVSISNCPNLNTISGLPSSQQDINLTISDLPSLTSLNGLPSLQRISFLIITGTIGFSDLSGIPSSIQEISRISLFGNNLSSLQGLPNQDNLDDLFISGSSISSFVNFLPGSLQSITSMRLSLNNRLQSLAGLDALASITNLVITANPRLSSFAGLPEMSISYLQIDDNGGINDLTSLAATSIDRLQVIGNISSLEGFPTQTSNLQKLDLIALNVPNLEGFFPSDFPSVASLLINGSQSLQDLRGISNGITALDELEISFNNNLTTLLGSEGITSVGNVVIRQNELLDDCCFAQEWLKTATSVLIERNKIGGSCNNLDEVLEANCEILCTDPVVIFNADNSCFQISGTEISFEDASQNILSDAVYAWDFGDGNANNMIGSVSHTYMEAGVYDVSLIVTQGDCSGQYVKQIEVYSNPEVSLTPLSDPICPTADPIVLTNGSPAGGKYLGVGVTQLASGEYIFDPSVTQGQYVNLAYLYTDQNGCFGLASTLINVTDEPPVLIVRNIERTLDEKGKITVRADEVAESVTDQCDPDNVQIFFSIGGQSLENIDLTCSDVGEVIVEVYAEDASGNRSSMEVATVTVSDATPPEVTLTDVTLSLDDAGEAILMDEQVVVLATDNCEVETISLSQTAFTCKDIGVNKVEILVTDISGNVSEGLVNVTIIDNLAPTISLLPTITLVLDNEGGAILNPVDLDDGTTDNCTAELTFSSEVTEFTCEDIGENPIEINVADESGNQASEIAIVVIVDDLQPEVIIRDITISLNKDGVAEISPEDLDDGSFDNCSIASLSIDQSTFTCDNVGDNEVTLTATDGSGNSASAIAMVTVEYERPVISEPEITASVNLVGDEVGIFFPYSGSIVSAQIDWGDGYIEDIEVTEGELAGYHVYAEQGVYSVKLTAIDACAGRPIIKTFDSFVIYENISAVVTGGGWFDSPVGAYVPDPTIAGKAHFAFAFFSYDKKDKKCGKLVFKVQEADLRFMSDQIEYMVVTPEHAFISGTGYMHGSKSYRFLLTVSDNKKLGNERDDRIRMKIWEKQSGEVVYDNQFGDPDGTLATQQIDRGAIVIHIKKSSNYESHEEDLIADYVDTDLSLARSYPNPVSDQLNVEIPASFNDEVRLMMYDQKGILVVDRKLNLVSGINNTVLDLAAMDLDRGVYMLRVQGTATSQTMRVIKN